jgi:endoribonuclease Dicer
MIGDAFLKYLSSIYVFVTNPAQKEGTLHIHRQRIISNKSLLQNASRTGLPQYIQGKPFSFKSWQPPNFNVLPSVPCNYEHRADVEAEDSNGNPVVPHADEAHAEAASGKKIPMHINLQSSSSAASNIDADLPAKSAVAENSKPKKKFKKKKQSDDQNTQWLGDKVRHRSL